MTAWFDDRAMSAAALSPEQKRKVAQIDAALRRSDRAVRDYLFSFDTFIRAAHKPGASGRVSGPWLDTIVKLQREVLRGRDRLDRLDTGLHAQVLLRRALTHAAAGVGAYRRGMGATDPAEIARAERTLRTEFAAARQAGNLGLSYLKQGR